MKTNQTASFFGQAKTQTSGLAHKTIRVIILLLVVMKTGSITLCGQAYNNWNDLKKCSKAEWEINDAQFDHDLSHDKEDWGEQVIQVSDGGYVVAGFSHLNDGVNESAGHPCGSYIAKFNANGNKVWCYNVPNDNQGSFIDVTETDNYYVAVGYSKVLKIKKDGTFPLYLNLTNMDLHCVKKCPDGIVICGVVTNTVSKLNGLFVGSLKLSSINNNSTSIYVNSNPLFNWISMIGNNSILPSSVGPISLTPGVFNEPSSKHLATDEWPITPRDVFVLPNPLTDQDYIGYIGRWLKVEELGGNNYNVYATGGAIWKNFTVAGGEISNLPGTDDLDNNPNTIESMPSREVKIDASDVIVLKLNNGNAKIGSTDIINVSWVKTYNKLPVAVDLTYDPNSPSTNEYARYNNAKCARRPQVLDLQGGSYGAQYPLLNSTQKIALEKYEDCMFNTMRNAGVFLDIAKTNTSKLIIGAYYNFADNENHIYSYGGEGYRDADMGGFVIDKITGDKLTNARPKLIAHSSGDDLKIRMGQNELGDVFTIGSTSDTWPNRAYNGYGEDYLTSKFVVNNTTNEIDVDWVRDIVGVGSVSSNISVNGGICGFGLGVTNDNGYVICGNNNQETIGGTGTTDDVTIMKMSPDVQINSLYESGFEPFQTPMEYTGTGNIINNLTPSVSSTHVIGKPIVVKSGAILTIENCTLEFANSKWLYDFPSLENNATTTNPSQGGLVGITVQKGGKLILNNCTLTGMKNVVNCINPVGNMWDGVVVEGDPQLSQNTSNQGNLIMNNATIEDAYIGVTLDGRSYSTQESANLYSYKIGYCPLYSDLISTMLGRAFFTHPNNNSYQGKGGGIINALNSTFRNNSHKDVEFMSFNNFANKSIFKNCDFVSNHHAPDLIKIDDDGDWTSTDEYVSIWANHGIGFYGCRFSGYGVTHVDPLNTIPQPDIYKNGKGIISLNSEFIVSGLCADNPAPVYIGDPCTNYIRSHFKNLQIAISAAPTLGQTATKYLSINNSEFGMFANGTIENEKNLENIFVNGGGKNVQIHHNFIDVADKYVSDPSQWGNPYFYPYGIHLQGTDGFMVEENTIKGGNDNNIIQRNDYGIVINDAGKNNNRVYLNSVSNLEHALVSLHINWNPNPNIFDPSSFTGLDWVCNDLPKASNNGIEVMSASNIRSYNTEYSNNQPNDITVPNSGHAFFQGSQVFPVNNTFKYNCGSTTKLQKDPSSFPYMYFINSLDATTDPNPCIQIGISTTPTASVNTCISHFNSGPIKQQVQQLNYPSQLQSMVSEEQIINSTLDAGGDGNLLAYINNPALGNNILREYLINAGPYLTDDIIDAAINRPNSPLTNAQLADIILANSPISDDNYEELEQARPILAENNTIVLAQYRDLNPRQQLQVQLGNLKANKRNLCIVASNYYMNLDEPDPITTANLFLACGFALDAVPYLIQSNNLTSANTLLNNFTTSNDEEEDAKSYLQLMVGMPLDQTPISQVINSNYETLKAISEHHTSTAYTVQNLLAEYHGDALPTATKPLQAEGVSNKTNKQKRQYNITNHLTFSDENRAYIFPNPAKGVATLNTILKDNSKEIRIEISNMIGQKVKTILAKAVTGNYTLDLDNLTSGTYIVKVVVDGEIILNDKLIVYNN